MGLSRNRAEVRLLFDENNGRRRFVREIQHYILSSSAWDETILEIAGLK
jgi:hypothetical protein